MPNPSITIHARTATVPCVRGWRLMNGSNFHAVFSIPSQLYPLVYANQKLLYDALYHAANKALAELSKDPKHFGARIGYICILHTWGSRLNYHPHLHVIVLGGGLDSENKWKDKGRKFFLPVEVMSAVFKKYYLNELKELHENDKLTYVSGRIKPALFSS